MTTVSTTARKRSGARRPNSVSKSQRERRVGRHRDAPALGGRAPEVEREVDRRAAPMPPTDASNGSTSRRRSRKSPRSNSRRASRPSTKKKNVISPLFTHSRSVSSIRLASRSIASTASHSSSQEEASTFTHTSAAVVAASRTAAPPLSVRRNSRTGLLNRRARAVVPDQRSARWSPSVRHAHGSAGINA
jgi:hypothetical protein